MRNVRLPGAKIYIAWFIIILLAAIIGALLGLSVGYALKNLKNQPVRIMSINEEALFKEKALKLAKLNLTETELKKELLNFKASFTDWLKALPPNWVVIRSNVVLRTDNVLDLTENFMALLAELQDQEIKK